MNRTAIIFGAVALLLLGLAVWMQILVREAAKVVNEFARERDAIVAELRELEKARGTPDAAGEKPGWFDRMLRIRRPVARIYDESQARRDGDGEGLLKVRLAMLRELRDRLVAESMAPSTYLALREKLDDKDPRVAETASADRMILKDLESALDPKPEPSSK